MSQKYTEELVAEILKSRYSDSEWVYLRQVRNATGSPSQTRTADAIAFNMWPTRGLAIHGHEIKVSRTDWQSELKNPNKAELIASYCDYWWIVTPEGIVQLEELPPTWGLIEVSGKKVNIKKKAPALRNGTKTPPREFWMSVMREFRSQAVQQTDIDKKIEAARNVARNEAYDLGMAHAEQRMSSMKEQVKSAEEREARAQRDYQDLLRKLGCTSSYQLANIPLKQAAALVGRDNARQIDYALKNLASDIQTLLEHRAQLSAEIEKIVEAQAADLHPTQEDLDKK